MAIFRVIWDIMPRNRLGTPYRRNYTEEQVESALRAVVDQNMSFSQASLLHGVSRNTVYRKYMKMNSYRLGKPPVLNTQEEKNIVNALFQASDFGYPFTTRSLRKFVQQYLNRKGVQVKCFHTNLPVDDYHKTSNKVVRSCLSKQ